MALQAAIFDLDGVVTATAKVHFAAWKLLFDAYLEEKQGADFKPFVEDDYIRYVDGMPRYDGVRTFLKSRGIELSDGTPDDSMEQETICGLGNRKNITFSDTLEEQGVDVYDATVALLKELRARGYKTAIVSSSKNCERILKRAHLEDLFDTRIDGVVLHELGRPGKPAPDMFLEAAERIGVDAKSSVVVEDAISGVQAGRAGDFGLVIGLDRRDGTMSEELLAEGADVALGDLGEVTLDAIEGWFLPSALTDFEEVKQKLAGKQPVVFLDYDGTLMAIPPHPDLALLSAEMRNAIKQVGDRFPTAVVTGRSLDNVVEKVALPSLYYAGNHGFEIRGPEHVTIKHEIGAEFTDEMDEAFNEISKEVGQIKGVVLEHKRLTLSVHFRLVDQAEVGRIEAAVDAAMERHPQLEKRLGKMIFEICPKVDWNKGKAVLWMLEAMDLDASSVLPIYIGDDVNDESAFDAIKERGLGVLVSDKLVESTATFRLKNPEEVENFLGQLLTIGEK